jgi:hypothetical protein
LSNWVRKYCSKRVLEPRHQLVANRCEYRRNRIASRCGRLQRQGTTSMAKDFSTMDDCNPSHNQSIHNLSNPLRRTILRGGLATTISSLLAPLGAVSLSGCSTTPTGIGPMLGFKSVTMNDLDTVTVPDGYRVQVLYRWGDAVGIAGNMPAYKSDASNTATEQGGTGGHASRRHSLLSARWQPARPAGDES